MWYQSSREMTSRWRWRACSRHCACAKLKKKEQSEIRTTATRSASERLTDCANRASLLTFVETIDLWWSFFWGLLLQLVFGGNWRTIRLGNAKGLNFSLPSRVYRARLFCSGCGTNQARGGSTAPAQTTCHRFSLEVRPSDEAQQIHKRRVSAAERSAKHDLFSTASRANPVCTSHHIVGVHHITSPTSPRESLRRRRAPRH